MVYNADDNTGSTNTQSIHEQHQNILYALNDQLSKISSIKDAFSNGQRKDNIENNFLQNFFENINDFSIEKDCLQNFIKCDKQLVKFLHTKEKHAKVNEAALKLQEENLRKRKFDESGAADDFVKESIKTKDSFVDITDNFHMLRKQQSKISELEKTLKKSVCNCFRIHKKNVILQEKLSTLKSKAKKDTEHSRLSYQFIESTSRFKINSFDGKNLSGCILPVQSTLKNSHIFEIYLGEDINGTSDWLWDKIYNFSIPIDLPLKYLAKP